MRREGGGGSSDLLKLAGFGFVKHWTLNNKYLFYFAGSGWRLAFAGWRILAHIADTTLTQCCEWWAS